VEIEQRERRRVDAHVKHPSWTHDASIREPERQRRPTVGQRAHGEDPSFDWTPYGRGTRPHP